MIGRWSARGLGLLGLAMGLAASYGWAETLYVAPAGNDAWSGRRQEPAGSDGPLATIHKAVVLARQQPAGQPRRIVLQPGEYWLEQPVALGPEDSGLTLEAAPGGPVALYGGRRVTGWQRDGDRLWAAAVPQAKDRQWDFRLLVVNGRLCPRARLPKQGTFTHLTDFHVPWMSTTGGGWKRKPTPEELTTMKYRPEDLGPGLDIHNAEVTVYHMWDESVAGLARIDRERQLLTFSNPLGHPPGAFGVKKYVVWNVREGLTEPGQWYLDRSAGRLVYWPLAGEDMNAAQVVAPKVESILQILGQPGNAAGPQPKRATARSRSDAKRQPDTGQQGGPVRDVTVRGLVLTVTNTPLVAGGFGASHFPGAVEVRQAEGCRLVALEIKNVAGQGVRASSVKALTIEGCHVHDTGAGGLKFDGQCLVRNNHVHHVGRMYPSGIAVWGGGKDGQSCRIEHNTIHDTTYTAVACGGDDHRIEANRISRAMQVLHDGAGIYITFCKRIVVRGNYIHDILETGGYGASAYYLDEQAEDCVVEGNLSVRVARPSHNHMARKNTVRGNVFVCDGDATLTFPRSADYCLENNVVVAQGAIRIQRPEAVTRAQNNVLFSRTGKVEGVALQDYRQAAAQPLAGGAGWLLADPGLKEYESGRVHFAPTGTAARLTLPTLDVSAAGCQAR